MTTAIAVSLSLLLLYFLSAGIAFAMKYRIGRRFPERAAGIFYAPLEWLARRSRAFRRLYDALGVSSYRLLVGDPLHGGWPPPPSL